MSTTSSVSSGTYVWTPGREYLEESRVARFASAHGVDGIDALRARSVADVSWYWDAVVTDLGLRFSRRYSRVVDLSAGVTDPEAAALGEDPGDLSGAENPDAVQTIRDAVERLR